MELALRYLSDYRVIVVAHPGDPGIIGEVVAAAGYAGAQLAVITDPGSEPSEDLPPGALHLEARRDADGTAARLGRYAAAVDAGEDLDTAYAVLTAATAES